MTKPQDFSSLRAALALLLPIFRRYRYRLLGGFLCLLGVDFFQLLIPQLLKSGIDHLSARSASPFFLLRLALSMVVIGIVVTVLRYLWRTRIIGFSRKLERDLRERIFDHLLGMDAPFFHRWRSGSLMALASNDLAAVQMACGMGMVAAVDAVVMALAATGCMMFLDLRLAVIALLPMPVLTLCIRLLSKRLHVQFAAVQAQFGRMTEYVRHVFSSVRLVKSCQQESWHLDRLDGLGRDYMTGNIRVATIQGTLYPLATLAANLGMLLVFFYGGRLVIGNHLSLGEFVAFLSYLTMLVWPMMAVGWVTNITQRGMTSLRRICHLLEQQPVVRSGSRKIDCTQGRLSIRCHNLSFSYPGHESRILTGLSCTFTPGLHGLAGRTGSGKTTLLKILARLYPVDENMLFFCGQDVTGLDLGHQRSIIAYAGEDSMLFADTIAANICFQPGRADQDRMIRAARISSIHEEIMNLPDGYHSRIGERGVRLSGGQRQRIALARALYSNRPVLLLDNALSALDPDTEARVIDALAGYRGDRIVILVSHRLELLRRCQSVLLLEGGVITDRLEGNHLSVSDLYRQPEQTGQ